MADATELYATLEEIRLHPHLWDQRSYLDGRPTAGAERWHECGTVGCFAGITALRHGWRPVTDTNGYATGRMTHFQHPGRWRWVGDVAQEILGISHCDRALLFAADNTEEDLEQAIRDIVGIPAALT